MVNLGSADLMIRWVFGLPLIATPFMPFLAGSFAGWGGWKFVVALIGVVLLGTSVMGFCPLYAIFGVRTCPLGPR
ncbi:MAG: DUF2892 domain-containing protein [Thermoanaerobaculales bacterium]|nr:DUF2892 domain-containing protein [Thermoanaerobaculales bacterium]